MLAKVEIFFLITVISQGEECYLEDVTLSVFVQAMNDSHSPSLEGMNGESLSFT